MWQSITGMIHEVKRVEAAGATTATVIMVYVCIDALAALALPRGREVQGKADFIAWVDRYLKAHPDQPYQYRGVDVYGARLPRPGHSEGENQSGTMKAIVITGWALGIAKKPPSQTHF